MSQFLRCRGQVRDAHLAACASSVQGNSSAALTPLTIDLHLLGLPESSTHILKGALGRLCKSFDKDVDKKLSECLREKVLKCLPAKWHMTILPSQNIAEYRNYLCKNRNVIEAGCRGQSQRTGTCREDMSSLYVKLYISSSTQEVAGILCSYPSLMDRCVHSLFPKCSTQAATIISESTKKLRNPKCSQPTSSRASSGGTSALGTKLTLLLCMAVLATAEHLHPTYSFAC
ncbi:uncharacterized protein LOC124113476 [Haliotis rufescens]|uniref:uncharacterized protein LOC124113476 n=1 Tax=Haliotis rufescens TaxID=6454 RepID=UPI00201F24D0|nr:uncharacterized protein LOC124113476 [Haliotis rufescens]